MSTLATTKIPTGTWQLDAVHSRVGFEVSYLAGTFRGDFADIAATLQVGENGAELAGSAKVASIRVPDENLTGHLLSPDFFDAERFPELTFTATQIVPGDELAVAGQLTIKGVTQDVEARGTVTGPIVDPYGNDRIGFVLSTTIDRTGFGLEWNVPLPSGEPALGNDVTIVAELQFVKAA
jgi:polyisoprenoid-binding protein YceI